MRVKHLKFNKSEKSNVEFSYVELSQLKFLPS